MNISEIDKLNLDLWNARYATIISCKESINILIEHAEKINYPRGVAYANLNLSFQLFLNSENEPAVTNISKSLTYFDNNTQEWGYVVALYLKGNIYEGFGDYSKALELTNKALQKAEENSYHEGIADANSVLGTIYIRLCQYKNAIKAFNECLTIRRELNDIPGIASVLNRMGHANALDGNFDSALNFYNQSIDLRKDNPVVLPWSYLGKASLFEKFKKYPEAEKLFREAIEISGGDGEKRCTMQLLNGLGRVLTQTKNLEEAGQYLNRALALAELLNSKSLICEARLALSDFFEKKGDFENAYKHYKQYDSLKESILNSEIKEKLHLQQISYAVEESKKEAEIFRLKNVELKEANKEITDSINYALSIQQSILPAIDDVKRILPQSFIFYRPKDIVSGDFYFVDEVDGLVFFSAVDCTGHGVPGALMSMLGHTFIFQAIHEKGLKKPNEILSFLDMRVNDTLKQSRHKSKSKDGMDLAFCVLDKKTLKLQFAGAFNPLYLIRNKPLRGFETLGGVNPEEAGIFEELKADKYPIGSNPDGIADEYTLHELQLSKGDMIYLFSDGYADQFGGTKNKKFNYKNLKQLLIDFASGERILDMTEQGEIIAKTFDSWKGNYQQIDDVIVMGVRV